MMQIPHVEAASPFNLEILTELYQKMTFPQRSQIFEIFLPNSTQFPSTNPPYPSSMFSTKGNQIISSLCALLGYYSDQWVDEPILGFLSIFSNDEKTTFAKYTDMDEVYQRLLKVTVPSHIRWEELCDIID
jgi:hypothetical protein